MKLILLSLLYFILTIQAAFSQSEDKVILQQQLLFSRERQEDIAKKERERLQFEEQEKQLAEQEKQLLKLRVTQKEAELQEEAAKAQTVRLNAQYQTALKDKFIMKQETDIRQSRRRMFYLLSVSSLILLATIIIYTSQRKTKRLNALITAQHEELLQVSSVKDRLLAIVGHDMRSPLNMLLGLSQILQQEDIPKEKMEAYMAQLETTLTHTSSMMDNLLHWAASQMDGYRPQIQEVNVADLASDVLLFQETRAADKGLSLHNTVYQDFKWLCDPNMLMLVLRNLVSNAVKFTASGGSITIASATEEKNVIITVTDTGIGMSKTAMDQFNSTDIKSMESTRGTNKEKGAGLGLLLCKTFIRLMNGRIEVTTNPLGKGSLFKIMLPHA